MRRLLLASVAGLLAIVASGIVACISVGVGTAAASPNASKTVFCGANDTIDRASANVMTNSGFLAVLKSHTNDLAIMKKDSPPGALGQTVQQLVSAAQAAVSSNNANALNSLPNGASVDTYCGVQGNGDPLPPYFGAGKTTTFCSAFVPIWQATQNAPNQAGVLSVLTAHQAQVKQLASELSTLPQSIKAKATAAVDKTQKAIATNNPSAIGGGNGGGPASYVALYCGQNQ